jgi:hypothetical protein
LIGIILTFLKVAIAYFYSHHLVAHEKTDSEKFRNFNDKDNSGSRVGKHNSYLISKLSPKEAIADDAGKNVRRLSLFVKIMLFVRFV